MLIALDTGGAQNFQEISHSFGTSQTPFGAFFIANYKLWFLAFLMCLGVALTGARRKSAPMLWSALALSLISIGSIIWGMYGGAIQLGKVV